MSDTLLVLMLSTLWTGLELWAFLLFMGAFIPVKKTYPRKTLIAIVCIFWVALSLYPNLMSRQLLKISLTVCLLVCLSRLIFHGKLRNILVLVSIHFVSSATIDLGITNGFLLLMDLTLTEFVGRKLTYTAVVTVQKLLLLFASWMVCQFKRIHKFQDIPWRYLLCLLLFPVSSGLVLTFLFLQSKKSTDLSAVAFIASSFLMLTNVSMVYMLNAINNAMQEAKKAELLEQQMKLQTENYEALRTVYALQRKSTHEFQHHIETIQFLIGKQEYAEVSAYIQHLQADRSLKVFSIHSNHPVIDAVLNQKYQWAQEHGIRMHIRINDLSRVTIPSNSLVVLLSNLLDNAIEACKSVSANKEIRCSILLEQELYISIRNTSLPVNITDNEIQSTKGNRLSHGYGIPAIHYILKQLNAEYGFDYTDGWFHFATEIPQ